MKKSSFLDVGVVYLLFSCMTEILNFPTFEIFLIADILSFVIHPLNLYANYAMKIVDMKQHYSS